jgi:nitrogen fixation NifU-like protein
VRRSLHVYVVASTATRMKDVAVSGVGVAPSRPAAALGHDRSGEGKTRAEAEALFETFHALVHQRSASVGTEGLGKLAVFAGVSEFPAE